MHFGRALMLHPSQHTIFARGVGPALTITLSSHPGVIDLVRYVPGARP